MMKQIQDKYFKILLLFLVAGLVFALAACGDDDAGTTGDNDEPSENGEESESNETGDGSIDESAGGVLKLGSGNVNIQAMAVASELRAFHDIFISRMAVEQLGTFDADGGTQPLLAQSWEENPEDATITFQLNEGIEFHDGTAFNAEAVKWNIDEFLESGRNELDDIESVEVLDDYILQVNLKEWNSSILSAIAHFVPISSPTAYEELGKEGLMENPIGTGPYKFVSWDRDEKIVFEKNENYWQDGLPYLDGVEIHFYADSTSAEASLQMGEVDGYISADALMARNIEEMDGYNVKVLETGLGGLAIGLTTDSANPDSPFSDPVVRRAVSYAIDRDAIVDNLQYGFAIASNQWGVPGAPSYNESIEITYDPDKSKELLAEAGYGDGFETILNVSNSPTMMQYATAVQGYLGEVGIEVELNAIEDGLYRELTIAAMEQPWEGLIQYNTRGDHDLATYMPRNFSPQATTFGHNLAHYDDMQELYAQIKSATDAAEVEELSKELQRLAVYEYALGTYVYVTGQPAPLHVSVVDTGINEGHASEWTPHSARFE
ncbi:MULTISPECIES: ABC transporter substrate-binding protein [Bacillaceae]|uniref:ABC transporter substrate-binding protein n=1 Tax=Evansella alkalicola TaxID=745819 RepID=A0ABS6JX82_9BACI|nr:MULTISPECIES: ABC transporter substrate-binding protein [Bacillaceae]MBU9723184.1 ABC transporter substrate-binding protein [Bacillus alkalicola]